MVTNLEEGRLILDPPANGAWNMAVDQALLTTSNQTGKITLRFYMWAKPTLSLGYFQRHEDRKKHAPSLECDLVRRTSGGGAIMHDHEITYSLCVPSSNRWSKKNLELYDLVHREIISLFDDSGIKTDLFRSSSRGDCGPDDDATAFLCFQRRTEGDIVHGANKVCGSAQRRLKNALIQHGSLLLSRSSFAPELPGLLDLTGKTIEPNEFCRRLAKSISGRLEIPWIECQLSELETESAGFIADTQFGNETWSKRR